ncbi:MAG: hypothetical protein H6744_17645 [Deltaproteobacteria bacterium]|nr:hypothetical protein [Deltaproteobacteria bacterium]
MTTTRPGAAIASLAWVALATGSATANMASPFQAGVLAGEPFGQTASMTILGERLTLDLRPLAGRDNAQVHAEYRIDNPGAPLDATLDFVATQITEAPTVLVDGRPVSATPQPDAPLPESWYPPETAPSFENESVQFDAWATEGVHRFVAPLASGPHTLDVRYEALPATFDGRAPFREHSLGYALAPARAWRSFGGLDVEVLLPPGWEAKSVPELRRDGDRLVGHFDALPADHLVVAVRPPPVSEAGDLPLWAGLVAGSLVALLLGGLAGRAGRRGAASSRLLGVLALVAAAGVAAAVVWATTAHFDGQVPRELSSRRWRNAQTFALSVNLALAVSAAVILAGAAAAIVRRSGAGGRRA